MRFLKTHENKSKDWVKNQALFTYSVRISKYRVYSNTKNIRVKTKCQEVAKRSTQIQTTVGT